MKLNADIIFESLKEYVPSKMFGYKNIKLNVLRPEFLIDNDKSFLANHLYIVRGERIPRRLVAEKGAVVICIGEAPQMAFLQERCCFIQVPQDTDPLYLSNIINGIFNKYDNWSEKLKGILENSADIDQMISCSESIFENPILLLNSNFRIISRIGYEGTEENLPITESADPDALSMKALTQFIEEKGLMMDVKEPMLLDIINKTTLCINLFSSDEYEGSLTIDYRKSEYKEGHKALLIYLSETIILALKKNSQIITSDRSILKRVFSDLVKGQSIDTINKRYIDSIETCKNYICTVLQINNRFAQIPVEFICSKMETLFPKSITFKEHSNVVSFIEIDEYESQDKFKRYLIQRIKPITESLDIKLGISNSFSNPYSARLFYLQSCAALENGNLIDPSKDLYDFKDYALIELIVNAQDELPIDMYYPKGLLSLFEHDNNSETCYVETLRVYLNNNMGITATAKELSIHRSTLIERMNRITSILDEDLKNPDIRLQIQIILKAIKIHNDIINKTTPS